MRKITQPKNPEMTKMRELVNKDIKTFTIIPKNYKKN